MREKNRGRRDSMEVVLQLRMKMGKKKSLTVRIREKVASKTLSRTECRKRRRRDNQWLRTQMSNTMEEIPAEKRRLKRSLKRKLRLFQLIMKMIKSTTHLKVYFNLMVEKAMMLLIQLKVAEILRVKVVHQQAQMRTKKIQCPT